MAPQVAGVGVLARYGHGAGWALSSLLVDPAEPAVALVQYRFTMVRLTSDCQEWRGLPNVA